MYMCMKDIDKHIAIFPEILKHYEHFITVATVITVTENYLSVNLSRNIITWQCIKFI